VTEAVVAFGGNLARPDVAFRDALALLAAHDGIEVVAASSLYRSAPWGPVEQPDFLNGIAILRTELGAEALADELARAEARFGSGHAVRWGPREIDLDLVAFGDELRSDETLTIPHPRLAERSFVLAPLAEVRPGWTHPETGATVENLLRDLRRSGNETPCACLEGSSLGRPLVEVVCRR
jgi:2-amino-4-hydroxy-6-hydroxymethyldihydropteridine diphosphokinase